MRRIFIRDISGEQLHALAAHLQCFFMNAKNAVKNLHVVFLQFVLLTRNEPGTETFEAFMKKAKGARPALTSGAGTNPTGCRLYEFGSLGVYRANRPVTAAFAADLTASRRAAAD